ncbi:hypothetical protein [Bacillus sp. BP-3]|uniref:hypothetical protein n=1 Tax=Bacillus sp. BP-3 TaxID=3022773 RepID=UPI00232FD728|nr:hypothetical protein [Bacillus sp. BP-3]MDC2863503.1 hypothetical protein [Bacillus sp. BP-3]
MSDHVSPRLRNVNKVKPPYPLNDFPKDFAIKLCEDVVYLLATRGTPELEGKDWEVIFANCIGATWKPSNVGLDDVVLDQCAWGAKTIKATSPFKTKKVRLISGRNSPIYSFGAQKITDIAPDPLGAQVLEIWNERVSAIRQHHKHVRTVVLIKSQDLRELVVFEYDTIRYDPELYFFDWNPRGNLQGYSKATQEHCFTWQPHGSQFTIIEPVPENHLSIRITKNPEPVKKEDVLASINFDSSWLEVLRGK